MFLSYLTLDQTSLLSLSTLLLGGIVAVASLLVFCGLGSNSKNKTTAPYAAVGMFETIRAISSPDAPWFCRRLHEDIRTLYGIGCYRLPLPMRGGAYVINDPKVAREIHQDSATLKKDLYKSFRPIGGGIDSIFSSETNAYWTFARK
jgi:hypothetical protein